MQKIELSLSDEELKTLIHILEKHLSDLSIEISHTDTRDFREELKHQKVYVEKVIEQLKRQES